jgi:hypothetical protein
MARDDSRKKPYDGLTDTSVLPKRERRSQQNALPRRFSL